MSIKIEHLNYVYSEGTAYEKHALKDICLEIPHGEFVGIIGHTGSGKSTLIRLVNGLETADSGKVTVCGKELSALKKPELRTLRRKIGMVFQQFNLLESKTVYHNIALPLILAKTPKAEIDKKVMEVLKIVELEDKKDVYVSQLSGGQKQRVAIVRALIMHPEVLLLDEITAALDPEMVREVLDVVLDLAKEGRTMVIVTHEMQFAKAVADRVTFLEGGKIVEEGEPKKLFEKPETDRLQRFLQTFTYEKAVK